VMRFIFLSLPVCSAHRISNNAEAVVLMRDYRIEQADV